MLRSAFVFALESHGTQRYGEQPYVIHLYDVVSVLIEFGFTSESLLSAAWLHDVIEDTPTTYRDVVRVTNKEVADTVFALTDELGKNRKERKEKTLPKVKANHSALTVKLADWIANLRECHRSSPHLLKMYQRDYPHFCDVCRNDNDILLMRMWDELDRLTGTV